MITTLIIVANFILMLENVTNVFIDAYKIKRALKMNVPVAVRHGINFTIYAVVVGLCIWIFHMHAGLAALYAFSAFFCRQITFDIPLNLKRGLAWDYVSMDRPPKALMDRIEVRLFGYDGRTPTIIYGAIWIASLTIQFFL